MSREASTLDDICMVRRRSTRCVVGKPIVGRALPTTCVAVIPTLAVSGSVVAGFGVAVAVYPFVHLWFRWVAFRAPKGGRK
jgi:mannose/fructose/N-acetylgalactosamine-specific phosphotransferase system component IID